MKKFEINFGKQDPEEVSERQALELTDMLPKNEITKTPEHIAAITEASKVVSDTLARLGIENNFSMNPDLVLLAKNRTVTRNSSDGAEQESIKIGKGQAFHKIIGGNIVISEGLVKNKESFMHALIHEFFHAASMNYGFLTKENENFDSRLIGKSGYASFYDSQSEDKDQFNGFNEAVTEELARECMKQHYDELFPNIDQDELKKEWNISYPLERQLLYTIILDMSGGNDEKIGELWKKLAANYISGSIMSLRDIEKFYGEGSLEILSQMTPDAGLPEILEKNKIIISYFTEKDPEKRKQIKETLQNPNKKNPK